MFDSLRNKTIIYGITGSIAAYKSPLIIRELVKAGADVKVVMTEAATKFVAPLVLANLSKNDVIIDMFNKDNQTSGAWHIKLSHSADLMIVAPCSATTLAKIAHGICDNPLVTLAIALPRNIPLLISPAMDSTMWLHPATQNNLKIAENNGATIIPPVEGELSSGLIGPGRFPENHIILEAINSSFDYWIKPPKNASQNDFTTDAQSQTPINPDINIFLNRPIESISKAKAKDEWQVEYDLEMLKRRTSISKIKTKLDKEKVLITAGPTYEKIDDVRFIANHSSGKMGVALATEAMKLGAVVTLITGPINIDIPFGIKRIEVVSADEMYDAAMKEFPTSKLAIMAAAVADFKPANPGVGKIKKNELGDSPVIELELNKDILADLGKIKTEKQILVGFALESANEIENALKKLHEKNCDMIVLNSANKPQSGFGTDDNTITMLMRSGSKFTFPPMSKNMCAEAILKKSEELI